MYHNEPTSYNNFEHKTTLQKEYEMINPCKDMLQKVLKLDRVHVLGDLSLSQIYEKMSWITQLGLRINKKNATSTRTKHQLLVVLINIGAYGLLTEVDEE